MSDKIYFSKRKVDLSGLKGMPKDKEVWLVEVSRTLARADSESDADVVLAALKASTGMESVLVEAFDDGKGNMSMHETRLDTVTGTLIPKRRMLSYTPPKRGPLQLVPETHLTLSGPGVLLWYPEGATEPTIVRRVASLNQAFVKGKRARRPTKLPGHDT